MNRLSIEKQSKVISCLVEGLSIRSTVRITGVAKNTITKLLVDIGEVSETFQRNNLHSLNCKVIQCDEIWAFCHTKAKNVKESYSQKGSVWTWIGIDVESKLVPYWYVGSRHRFHAKWFMRQLAQRFNNRVQISTDGLVSYTEAIDFGFEDKEIDFAIYKKIYSKNRCVGAEKIIVSGKPDINKISTSLCERQNLTMRMGMRRFTRKTNAFSKKFYNHRMAVALHFMYYNFCRIHQTIKTTPAIAAGVANHVWKIEDIISLSRNS